MGICIGAGLSTHPDPRVGAIEAASAARAGLGGAHGPDLAVVFLTGSHLAAPEAALEGVHETLAPDALVGCGTAGVLAAGREVEDGAAIVVWAASLEGEGRLTAFHARAEPTDDGFAISGFPDLDGASAAILMPDPFTFPTEAVLASAHERRRAMPLIGGLASARTAEGASALFHGEEVVDGGAVGVLAHGVEVLPCVSQGAAPIGPEMTVTAAEGNVIHELAGKPALRALREVLSNLDHEERAMIAGGLLMGLVVGGQRPHYERGDFLVRGLVGADPESGTVAVGAPVHEGQVVRIHARDADSADRDLREALELRLAALGGARPAGALAFTCNGRGRGMFGCDNHDAQALDEVFRGAPVAGFFAAGEIGPVGGESFVHGFTATIAVFVP